MASLNEAIREIKKDLKGVSNPEKLLLSMAKQAHTDILLRVFTNGQKSDGTKIGQYAESTKKAKKRKGRLSGSNINLRDTERLVDSFIFELFSNSTSGVGFEDVKREDELSNGELSDILEKNYGAIFDLTKEEDKRIDIIIEDFLDDLE